MKKIIYGFFGVLILLIGSAYLILSASCDTKEIMRLSSPDNRVDSVTITKDCGATTSRSYRIFLVPKDENVSWFDSYIFKADRISDLEVIWAKNKELVIQYATAQIFDFTNFQYMFLSNKNRDGLYKIDITERHKLRSSE